MSRLLDRDADIDAVLRIDVRADDEREYPEDANGGGVAGRRHCAKARHKARRSSQPAHWHRNGYRLVRQRTDQGNRQHQVNQQPYRPKGVDGYYVHGSPPVLAATPGIMSLASPVSAPGCAGLAAFPAMS